MALARDKRAHSDGLGGARFDAAVKPVASAAVNGGASRPVADRVVYVPPPASATQAQLVASVQALASAVGVKPDKLALPCLSAWRKGSRLFVWRDENARGGIAWQACEGRVPEPAAPEPAAPAAPVKPAPAAPVKRAPLRERGNLELLELFRSRHAIGDDRNLIICAEIEQILWERGYGIYWRKGQHVMKRV